MKKVLAILAMSFVLGAPSAQAALDGKLGIAENTCVSPIALFVGAVCSYSGGANFTADLSADPYYGGLGWIGPLDAGGFYASVAAAPDFVLSSSSADEFCAEPPAGSGCPGRALNTFLVTEGTAPGDGKVAPTIDGSGITMTGSGATATLGGTFTMAAGVRQTGTGGALQGSKQVIETWSSITHTITPKLVDDNTALGGGAFEYIIGSDGFAPLLCSGSGDGGVRDCFASEKAADSGDADNSIPPSSPWLSGNGPQTSIFDTAGIGIDIVSYGLKGDGAGKNFGAVTTAVMAGATCSDTGLDPDEADTLGNVVVDDVSDCVDSAVAWTNGDNASFDNMILKITTDTGGAITDIRGYYVLQYQILGSGVNSWVGGRILLSTDASSIPVPAAVWLFGSALGLLGWIRRRSMA